MNRHYIPIERIRLFSADGQLYRAFGHLIAARMGTLLLVPDGMVFGEMGAVLEGCPVPAEEVYAVLEYTTKHPLQLERVLGTNDHLHQLEYLGLNPSDCAMDTIAPMTLGREKVLRLVHPCGVRYAVVRTIPFDHEQA